MRKGFALSVLFHVLVFVLGYFGLPQMKRPAPLLEPLVMVEIVPEVSDKTNLPTKRPEPEPEKPKPAPEPEAKPTPPPPPPPAPPPPPPPPKPEPAPEPLPEPAPKKEEAKKEPEPKKPEPKPEPKPVVPPELAHVTVKRKPTPPSQFASVLKSVEDLKKTQPKPDKDEKKKPEKTTSSFDDMIAKAVSPTPRLHDPTQSLTISEIDLVRQKIADCWNPPAGAKDAENLIIEIKVFMNPDGTPRQAHIQDQARMRSDGFFRAAAESALRAVLNPRCHPYPLPREKYDHWKDMTLSFNPKEMFGL